MELSRSQMQAIRYFINAGVKAVGLEQGAQVPRAAADLMDLMDAAERTKGMP